ncbi:MAG: hypothetical protein CO184_00120 [Candidatus Zambryskibacteria bacterium CG_4_9_14_3_um_filter_40_16]|uniref:Methionine--tRNA ligase n=2 Tax=Candidatus Zambryskiibacteriota TaxID=1817925 RepID=A0A2H0K6V7_9BACT|nr:MAG: hypothetical protein COV95_01150 [Candidatus Zambryskibacteria bacterium CG11_big_fil_rev_8_21_14_0_20_40_24]PJA34422.1 MAG: hypothetical protein CO184_00120 [Candidatus Zambryskibacteria bacterium CG_4_9_14_3_um_filter_40_16]
MINFEDFKKIEVRIGEILKVEKIPDSEKLLKLTVDLGEENPRQIISGISPYFSDPSVLEGKKCPFVVNLEPRKIFGFESQGMILCASSEEDSFSLLEVAPSIKAGTLVK